MKKHVWKLFTKAVYVTYVYILTFIEDNIYSTVHKHAAQKTSGCAFFRNF